MILKATVIKGIGGLYTVRFDEEYNGKKEAEVRARGAFRHDGNVLLPGDRVDIEVISENEFFCKKILERKNSLIRPPLANLDYLFIAVPCKKPDPVLETVDKMISIAEYNSIEPIIVVTKSDLENEAAEEIYGIYKKSGFDTFVLSSRNGEGVDELYGYIKKIASDKDVICAFCGASGAGKSTLINALFPTLSLETGDLSKKIERGKNTTRCIELFPFEKILSPEIKGYLADTPGFSLIDFERFDFFPLDALTKTFREFKESIGKCRYTGCTHLKEEGCDIIRRVKNGEIPKSRHDSYVSMYEILKEKKPWKK